MIDSFQSLYSPSLYRLSLEEGLQTQNSISHDKRSTLHQPKLFPIKGGTLNLFSSEIGSSVLVTVSRLGF